MNDVNDAISRQAAIDALRDWEMCYDWDEHCREEPKEPWVVSPSDVVNKLPPIQPELHWIPVTERLPKEEGFYLVTLEDKCGAETTIRFFRIENGEHQWSVWGNETITAWMPLPEPMRLENK